MVLQRRMLLRRASPCKPTAISASRTAATRAISGHLRSGLHRLIQHQTVTRSRAALKGRT